VDNHEKTLNKNEKRLQEIAKTITNFDMENAE
jgi:hypothetical protein